jgi:Kef-type K+ transport system membrane component KefB
MPVYKCGGKCIFDEWNLVGIVLLIFGLVIAWCYYPFKTAIVVMCALTIVNISFAIVGCYQRDNDRLHDEYLTVMVGMALLVPLLWFIISLMTIHSIEPNRDLMFTIYALCYGCMTLGTVLLSSRVITTLYITQTATSDEELAILTNRNTSIVSC